MECTNNINVSKYYICVATVVLILCLVISPVTRAEIDCGGLAAMGCCCEGTVGNVDCSFDNIVDISDLTRMIDYLFISNAPLQNRDEANIDLDPSGMIDIYDLTLLISHLFIDGQPLPNCPGPYNTPPDTRITNSLSVSFSTFIDGTDHNNQYLGVPLSWEGIDLVDHTYDNPTFEFEWRLYGPYPSYGYDSWLGGRGPDTTWENLYDQFIKAVYLRNTGEVITIGEGNSFEICDTLPDIYNPGQLLISCDNILVDTIKSANSHGYLDTIFDINSFDFQNNPLYNKIAVSSSNVGSKWTTALSHTIYDAFNDYPTDTTSQMHFIFWIRSNDPADPTLFDPTPAFNHFTIIKPMHERDIGIVNIEIGYHVNSSYEDSTRAYWARTIQAWEAGTGIDINYDADDDYIMAVNSQGFQFDLQQMLSYKSLIFINDNPFPGAMGSPQFVSELFRTINIGVPVWMTGRAQVIGGEAAGNMFDWGTIPLITRTGLEELFGISNIVYSGWEFQIYYNANRIEDFVGATATNPSEWPDLAIDTALLHQRYMWQDHYPWVDTIAALPEVNWLEPTGGAEVLYNYKSLYGADHFLPHPFYNFEGKAVAIRKQTALTRTSYWLFTPYALEESTMQTAVDSMLNYLWDGRPAE